MWEKATVSVPREVGGGGGQGRREVGIGVDPREVGKEGRRRRWRSVAVKEVACAREGKRKESSRDRAASASGLRAVGRGRPQDAQGTRFWAQRVVRPYSARTGILDRQMADHE